LADGQAEAMPARFDDLPERLRSALVLAPIALVCLWEGGAAWALLVALAGVGVAGEWVRIVTFRPAALPGVVLPMLVAASCLATGLGFARPALAALCLATAALATVAGPREAARRWLAAGMLYLGVAAVAAIWLRHGGAVGRGNVLFVILIVWASDTGAYLVGRFVGGPKLVPRVSPSKTWAGALGGTGFAVAAGLLVAVAFAAGPSLGVVAVSIALGTASQAGDLVGSVVKRRFGVKHSSMLIPGHGGLLDRLAGVLAAAPVASLLVLVLGRGAELWR